MNKEERKRIENQLKPLLVKAIDELIVYIISLY